MEDIKNYTSFEMMLIAAAREIKNNDTIFGAIQWPFLVLQIANRLHAPELNIVLETGTIHRSMPDKLPFSIIDPDIIKDSIYVGDSIDSLGFLQRGNIDKAFLSASILDKYGNCNTTTIGKDYEKPIYRLPGGGGATEVAALSKRLYWLLDEHSKRRLVPKVDFITDIGYIEGGNSKIDYNYPENAKVEAIITPLCILKFDENSKEPYLDSIFTGTSIEEVMKNTGWPLKKSKTVKIIDPPSKREIEVCRSVIKEAIDQYYILKPEWIKFLDK
ncbi:MAG: CoA-transferase subunit beta [Candidatus Lokiarchaeota archaeon]|nr:CoA-transferase subunit beta [Candidatus Lokiarchaeota archaeon]